MLLTLVGIDANCGRGRAISPIRHDIKQEAMLVLPISQYSLVYFGPRPRRPPAVIASSQDKATCGAPSYSRLNRISFPSPVSSSSAPSSATA